MQAHQETCNLEKYERAGRVESMLVGRFVERVVGDMRRLAPVSVLDAGCGEGVVTGYLATELPAAAVAGVDARPAAVAEFRRRNPALEAFRCDLYGLPFADRSFELVIATEVLEHLERPRAALRELARVAGRHLYLTVPHEPFFRAANLARGRYVRRLGSTPGHQRTWGRRGFLRLVGSEARVLRWSSALPWQAVTARVHD